MIDSGYFRRISHIGSLEIINNNLDLEVPKTNGTFSFAMVGGAVNR